MLLQNSDSLQGQLHCGMIEMFGIFVLIGWAPSVPFHTHFVLTNGAPYGKNYRKICRHFHPFKG